MSETRRGPLTMTSAHWVTRRGEEQTLRGHQRAPSSNSEKSEVPGPLQARGLKFDPKGKTGEERTKMEVAEPDFGLKARLPLTRTELPTTRKRTAERSLKCWLTTDGKDPRSHPVQD